MSDNPISAEDANRLDANEPILSPAQREVLEAQLHNVGVLKNRLAKLVTAGIETETTLEGLEAQETQIRNLLRL